MFYTYIVTNPGRTTLYIGVTNDLHARIAEHYVSRGSREHFASKYHCHQLIYFEKFDRIIDAISREKELKGWRRAKKLELISKLNPTLKTLLPP
jgi:putative endonuclease